MASATGIPDRAIGPEDDIGEEESLLGQPGDASQKEGFPLYQNLVLGTGVLAEAGILLLVTSVWANVFLHPLILFSAHPLLNSAGLLAVTEAVLILQPTHTGAQKRQGAKVHAAFNSFAIDVFIAAFVIIEVNKFAHAGTHFESPHAILGLITYIILFVQATIGVTVYFFPTLYGGEGRAKSLYKWHRFGGYVSLALLLATAIAATQTDYNKETLGINVWAIIISAALILLGVVPRIKKQKFGFGLRHAEESTHID